MFLAGLELHFKGNSFESVPTQSYECKKDITKGSTKGESLIVPHQAGPPKQIRKAMEAYSFQTVACIGHYLAVLLYLLSFLCDLPLKCGHQSSADSLAV